MAKNKNSGGSKILTVLLAIVLSLGVVGTIGFLSKGFQDWNFENWNVNTSSVTSQENKKSLIKLELGNDIKGSLLDQEKLLEFVNGCGGDGMFVPLGFDDDFITSASNIYKDEGGLKFGTSGTEGYMGLGIGNDYSFNRIKITGRNYSTLSSTTKKYSCDSSCFIVNGSDSYFFDTNEKNDSEIAPINSFEISFSNSQKNVALDVIGGRAVIFSVEMWTE